jgi:V/A-type H+/Na+-transporting ATPase subunit C
VASSPYASPLGRLKAQFPSFLSADQVRGLAGAADVAEIAKLLEGTPYTAALAQSAATYKGAELLEVALNRLFVERNRLAFETSPFAGRPTVGAYLKRWDIQNLGLILSARAEGRPLKEREVFLVSSREIPAGLVAGTLTLDDLRALLPLPSVEAIVNAVVRYGYGAVLLPLVDEYGRTGDIFPLLHALDVQYYREVLDAARLFQGDEWTVREFLRSEIDARNALLLLKGKATGLPAETVFARFFDGGSFPKATAEETFAQARSVPDLAQALEGTFPHVTDATARFESEQSLVAFETVLARERLRRELTRMRAFPLSLAIVFTFLAQAEVERDDLRRIVFSKVYGVPTADVMPLLLRPQLG